MASLPQAAPRVDLYGRPYSASIGDRRERNIAEELAMTPYKRIELMRQLARLRVAVMGRDSFVQQEQLAEQVSEVLKEHGASVAVMGGHAVAVHGHPRLTQDIDLLTSCDVDILSNVARELQNKGFEVELRPRGPIGEDPLDGTITVRESSTGPVQVVNIKSGVGRDAVSTAIHVDGYPLPVVALPHLIALKLKAYSPLDRADVIELLTRNPSLDRVHLRNICERFRVSKKLDRIIAEMSAPPVPDDE